MKKFNYILFVAALLPLLLFKFTLWTIDLEAPQFPEGLQIRIFVDKITGDDEHDLESVNRLNHYIGMKNIEPDQIPELSYMPIIVITMAIIGIIFSFLNKNYLFLTWTIIFTILGIIGIYDFYTWNSDFGTNLDPNAIIKTAGITYQPPIFGTKQILNFKVTSLPGIGGIALFVSIFLCWIKIIIDYFIIKKSKNVTA